MIIALQQGHTTQERASLCKVRKWPVNLINVLCASPVESLHLGLPKFEKNEAFCLDETLTAPVELEQSQLFTFH